MERSRQADRVYRRLLKTRDVRLASPAVSVERRADRTIILRSPHELGAYPGKLTERLEHWARVAPDRTLFAQRAGASWRRLTYADAIARARRVGEALLEKGLSTERPLVVLSGNDLDHALLHLGALYAGIPYAPVSPAYSLLSTDFAKLRSIFELLTPGLAFVSSRETYRKALGVTDCEVIDRLEEPAPTPGVV